MTENSSKVRIRTVAYARILWGLVFLWIFGLGMRAGAWKMVIVPLLGMAAVLIWAEKLKRQYPQFAPKLIMGAAVFMAVFATSQAFPQLYETAKEMAASLDLNVRLKHEPPLLSLQQALTTYVAESNDADGRAILDQLNKLKVKHDAGTFGPDDQKVENALFQRAIELGTRNSQLRTKIERIPHPTADTTPQSAAADTGGSQPKPQTLPTTPIEPSARVLQPTAVPPSVATPKVDVAAVGEEPIPPSGDNRKTQPAVISALRPIASTEASPPSCTPPAATDTQADITVAVCQCQHQGNTQIACSGWVLDNASTPVHFGAEGGTVAIDSLGNEKSIFSGDVRCGDHLQRVPLYPGERVNCKLHYDDPSAGAARVTNIHLHFRTESGDSDVKLENIPLN